nr:MAG TPA: hypothetical protein [Caudoviricetes sp.]
MIQNLSSFIKWNHCDTLSNILQINLQLNLRM